MEKSTIKIDVQNTESFKNLVHLLEKHFEDLPKELRKSILEIEENGLSDFGREELEAYCYIHNIDIEKIELSFTDREVWKINKPLKRLKFADGTFKEVESFSVKCEDHVLIEW